MKPDFQDHNDCWNNLNQESSDFEDKQMDILQRDRSELLSAYLDGEVTSEERQKVQQWLETDAKTQCLYNRLIRLREGLQTMPIEPSPQSANQIARQVFQRINRRRIGVAMASTGGAIAAMFIASVSGIFGDSQSYIPQLAEYSPHIKHTHAPLMVAVNRPVIEIPKAPVAAPENSVKKSSKVQN